MALPTHILERLPGGLRKNGLLCTADQLLARELAPTPQTRWADVLLGGAWPEGQVSELALASGSAGATTLGLWACRHAQAQGARFCAFVDPAGHLHAPGVEGAGVSLTHLLVVRPPLEALSRVSIRLAEAQQFAQLVVDLSGSPASPLDVQLGDWVRVVRRLSQAVSQSRARVLLLTQREAHRPIPLPVAVKVEVTRPEAGVLSFRVKKSPDGRLVEDQKLHFRSGPALATTHAPDRSQAGERETHVA